MRPKIIVLTPVKNEVWILDRFLATTSQLADHILILDQQSSDESLVISKKYPKVTVLANPSTNYDEASRQLILINTAREMVPGPRILIALDADEIFAANAMHTEGWKKMLSAAPGTVLFFEKPDLYQGTSKVIRYQHTWPLGYVDDGIAHVPQKIHSIRIPNPIGAPRLELHDIKIMHYALTRMNNQVSKMRYYSMLENLLQKNNMFARRHIYRPDFDYINANQLEMAPDEWYRGWEQMGIDMHKIPEAKYFWYDLEALKLFEKHGSEKFWVDNIWEVDWNHIQDHYSTKFSKSSAIKPPPYLMKLTLRWLDKLFSVYRKLR